MASFLCQVQTIQRAAGRSAVAAAAYRSGVALTDERLAMDFDFAGKDGVELGFFLHDFDAHFSVRDGTATVLELQTGGAMHKKERRKAPKKVTLAR